MKFQHRLETFLYVVLGVCIIFGVVYVFVLIHPAIERIASPLVYLFAGLLSVLAIGGTVVLLRAGWHWSGKHRRDALLIHPNEHNVYPALIDWKSGRIIQAVNGDMPVAVPQTLTKSEHYHNDLNQLVKLMELRGLPQPQGGVQELPSAPPFRAIEHLLRADRFLICYAKEPVWGTVDDLLSTNVTGKPGRGKTIFLYFCVGQFLKAKAQIIAFDPHGSMIEIADYISYEHEYEAMSEAVPAVRQLLQERLQAFKQGKPFETPVLFIVDELPAIAVWEQEQRKAKRKVHSILSLIQSIILESRKTRMYAILSGQTMSHRVLPTDARDNLSSHFVFESTNGHASMAGLEQEDIKALLPLLKGRARSLGRCVVSLARESEAFIGAIPETTKDDLARIVESTGTPLPLKLGVEVSEVSDGDMPALSDLKKETNVTIFPKQQKYRDVTYDEVVEAWNTGYNTKRSLAKYLNISEWSAQAWCKRMNDDARNFSEDNEEQGQEYYEEAE